MHRAISSPDRCSSLLLVQAEGMAQWPALWRALAAVLLGLGQEGREVCWFGAEGMGEPQDRTIPHVCARGCKSQEFEEQHPYAWAWQGRQGRSWERTSSAEPEPCQGMSSGICRLSREGLSQSKKPRS